MLLDPQTHLGVAVAGSVRILLAGKRQNYAGIVFANGWEGVAAISTGDFNARPLAPQVDSGRSFHHFVDISSAHAGRALQKIELAIRLRADELRVRNAAKQPQGRDQVNVDGAKRGILFASPLHGEGREHAAMSYVHRRLAILTDVGK